MLRPFVYRRYLDFSVFESLRDMKAMIAREVERRELQDNVKLGPGGIREIEFIVQALPADAWRQRPAPAEPRAAHGVAAARGAAAVAARSRRGAGRGVSIPARASRIGCSNGTTSRRTSCRKTTRRGRGSRIR